MKKIVPMLVILILIFFTKGEAAVNVNLTLTGDWSKNIGESDVPDAGSPVDSSYGSASNQVIIGVAGFTGSSDTDTWRVDVRRTDTDWNSNIIIKVRRTSEGTGNGTISGGTVYQEITTSDSAFFTGAGDRSGINLEYKIEGISLSGTPIHTNTTTINCTLTDTP